MHARGWIVVVVVVIALTGAVGAAPKDPKPLPIDNQELVAPVVLQDADGGTYVVDRPTKTGARIWYGTGTKLYEQVVSGRSRDGAAWTVSTWAPRVANFRPAMVQFKKDGSHSKVCGDDVTELALLTGDKAKAVLDKAKLFTSALVRYPHMLARDDRGVYYYVDRLTKVHGGMGFRVMVGRKGGLKTVSLKDVASDSAGEVFSTKLGDLRLVRTAGEREELTWIRGSKRTELIPLDTTTNARLIFTDLGVYTYLGTICDNG